MAALPFQRLSIVDSPTNSSRLKLENLPREIIIKIFWGSRELSMINVNQYFHSFLPEFGWVARYLSILAFCEYRPPPEDPERTIFHDPMSMFMMEEMEFPSPAEIKLPLSPSARKEIYEDVVCSDWWNLDRFHRMNLGLFKFNFYSIEDLWCQGYIGFDQSSYNRFQSRTAKVGELSSESFADVGVLQHTRFNFRINTYLMVLRPNSRPPLARTYGEGLLISFSRSSVCFHFESHPASWDEDRHDWYFCKPTLFPPRLIQGPLTQKRREIITCFMQILEARGGGVPKPQMTWAEVDQAVYHAIQFDEEVLLDAMLRLRLLIEDRPRHYFGRNNSSIGEFLYHRAAIRQGKVKMLRRLETGHSMGQDTDNASATIFLKYLDEARDVLSPECYAQMFEIINQRKVWYEEEE